MDLSSGWRVCGAFRRSELRLHSGEAKQDGSVGRFEKFSIKKGVFSFSFMRFELREREKKIWAHFINADLLVIQVSKLHRYFIYCLKVLLS